MKKSNRVRSIVGNAIVALAGVITTAQAQTLPPPPISPTPVTNYEYDAQGNPTRVIQAPGVAGYNFATSASYDSLSRRKDSTDAKAGRTAFDYDGLDRLTRVTDPRNLVTQYPRNGLGDVSQLISPDTGTASHTYDAAGNLKTRTDSRGVLATYTYDVLNRLSSVVYSQSGQTSVSYSWTYDQTGTGFSYGIGRLTTATFPAGSTRYAYDALGRLTSAAQTTGVTLTTSYGYDAGGRINRITYPSGRVLTISYVSGLPSAIQLARDSGSTPQTLISQITLQPFGGVESWLWHMNAGTVAHQRAFDLSGRMVRYPLGSTVRDITYDAADRITGYAHLDGVTGAAAPALNQSFGYDELGRLTNIGTASANWSIGYDANGNRTSVALNGSASAYTTSATSNRLTAISNPARDFTHDAAGNTTSDNAAYTATYGLDNRLVSLNRSGLSAGYSYDAIGQRVRKVVNGTTTHFVYGQNGQLLGEYDAGGNAIREYVWLEDIPVAVFTPDAITSNPPVVYYVHSDHINAPRIVVDRNGNRRWRWIAEPFGSTAAESNPDGLGHFAYNLRFPGQYFDSESGLHYNYFRDYDATIGRYVQSDPIGLEGGANTYAYVSNSPLTLWDLFGLVEGSPSNIARRQAIDRIARSYNGSTVWAYSARKDDFPSNTNKCNKFVYDVTMQAGAAARVVVAGRSRPPLAAEWASRAVSIPNWRMLGPNERPEPGDVAAYRLAGGGTRFSGHTGLMTSCECQEGVANTSAHDSAVFPVPGQFEGNPNTMYRRYIGE